MPHLVRYQQVAKERKSDILATRYGLYELNDIQLAFLEHLMVHVKELEDEYFDKMQKREERSKYEGAYKINNDPNFGKKGVKIRYEQGSGTTGHSG